MGGFSTIAISRHPELRDREVGGVIDHADGSVTRVKLEPATASPASLVWSVVKGRIQWPIGTPSPDHRIVAMVDPLADATLTCISADLMRNVMRADFANKNGYIHEMSTGKTTQDNLLTKFAAGTPTVIGYEAVDLSNVIYTYRLSAVGSTLYCYRDDLATAKFSVTDTAYASGCWGVGASNEGPNFPTALGPLFGSSLEIAKVLAYFEAPIIGSGTSDDPFRAQMPELIDWEWSLSPAIKKKYNILKAKGFTDEEIQLLFPEVLSCRVNRLALTYSSLIKTNKAAGKPVEYVAIMRVFEQPDRQAHLYPIAKCLDALRALPGVRELSRDEAIKRAKQIDPDLTDVDLMPIKATDPNFKQVLRDYIAHREGLGVKRELIDNKLMERYLQEDKGW